MIVETLALSPTDAVSANAIRDVSGHRYRRNSANRLERMLNQGRLDGEPLFGALSVRDVPAAVFPDNKLQMGLLGMSFTREFVTFRSGWGPARSQVVIRLAPPARTHPASQFNVSHAS